MIKNFRLYSVLITGAALALLALLWWQRPQNLALGTQGPKVLKAAIESPFDSLDPAVAFNDSALTVIGQVVEPLYQYHYLKRPFQLIPLLADGLPEVSEDGLHYTIRIKPQVKYHPHPSLPEHRTVTAQDFINQIKRLAFQPLNSPGGWIFRESLIGFKELEDKKILDLAQQLKSPLKGALASDPLTLELKLKRPEPNLLFYLAMMFVVPQPIEYLLASKNDIIKQKQFVLGTGPFQLKKANFNIPEPTQQTLGEALRNPPFILEKFSHYREDYYPMSGDRFANTKKLISETKKQLPFLEKIEFFIMTKEDLRWRAFHEGYLHFINVPGKYLPQALASQNDKKSQFELNHFSKLSTRWLSFNMNDPLWGKNQKLREAIALAVNPDEYNRFVFSNSGIVANSILMPQIAGYRPDSEIFRPHDQARAKELVNQVKQELGLQTIEITYSTRGFRDTDLREAEFVKTALTPIGIKVKIDKKSFSEFLKFGRAGKLQFWTDAWIYDYPDGENIVQLLIGPNHPGINKSGYNNLTVNRLYQQLNTTLDERKRFKIFSEIESEVRKDLPWIMMVYESTYLISNPRLKNFRKSFMVRNFFKYLDLRN